MSERGLRRGDGRGQQHRTQKPRKPRVNHRTRLARIAAGIGGTTVIVVILWMDIATGFWQNLPILSGLAAGLVTFLLTVLVLDRVLARANARRWAPVSRLALTDFLYSIIDVARSELSRNEFQPLQLLPLSDAPTLADTERILKRVVTERMNLSNALARWAQFLASNEDYTEILRHVADIALQFERVADAALELEASLGREASIGHAPVASELRLINAEISETNALLEALVQEITDRLELDAAEAA